MPANPFSTNDPIPSATPPLSGEAHEDIDAVTTVVTQNINPDGTMPDGSGRAKTITKTDRISQPGAPAYQKSPNHPQGRC